MEGGNGEDILIGDIGHCVRRYEDANTPTLQSNKASKIWHKDIVLEELGVITAVHRISTKIDPLKLVAEDVMSASILFVANAVRSNGEKVLDGSGNWITDLIMFDVEQSYDDTLDGGDGDDWVFGQRGNDKIIGGLGNDLLVGDSGTNLIPQDMNLPRVYNAYRTLIAPPDSSYVVNVADYGAMFTFDHELYPFQYRQVDSLGSIIDKVVNIDDIQSSSNLVHDIIGISALATDESYCMQPMFRVTPGFLSETQRIHGNDEIYTGAGDNIAIGDDIRGSTPVDLTQLPAVQNQREILDNLIVDLGVRLSTLEVDTDFFADTGSSIEYNITVGSDTITTYAADGAGSQSLVTGDSLTIFGRSVLGDVLGVENINGILNRLFDIEIALVDLHLALFEIHTNLLKRMSGANLADTKEAQVSKHALSLSNDVIDSFNDGDIIIGDSSALYLQADRPSTPGFEFSEFSNSDANTLKTILSDTTNARQDEIAAHIESLSTTTPLTNTELSNLPYADVPFLLRVGADALTLHDAANLAVGDFATIGITLTFTPVNKVANFDQYGESIYMLRKQPSVSSFFPLTYFGKEIGYYYQRYDSVTKKAVEPFVHGDKFVGTSPKNTMLGEFYTGIGYVRFDDSPDGFVFDDKANFYDTYDNAEWAINFDGDTFDVFDGASVDGQKGQDEGDPNGGGKVSTLEQLTKDLFYSHALIVQMKEDVYNVPIDPSTIGDGLKTGYQCTDPIASSYVPSFEYGPLNPTLPNSNGPPGNPPENPTDSPSGNPTESPVSPTIPGGIPTAGPTTGPTTSPSASPTQIPTGSPTTGPTSSPSVTPTSCEDDGAWRYSVGKKNFRDCAYIAKHTSQGLCSKVGVNGTTGYEACRVACGVC